MQTQEPKFTKEMALEFSEELWGKVKENGFGAWGKNDIYDYLLYLFNKHGGGFFDANSNEQNERLLKTTATKIKASKKNIAVKFMDDGEYRQVFKDFLNSLSSSNEKSLVKENEKGELEFVIENNVLKDMLGARLKKWCNEAPEYSLNAEKLTISYEAFVTMIKMEVRGLDKEKEYEKIVQSLEKKYNFSNLKNLAKKGVKAIRDFAPLVASII